MRRKALVTRVVLCTRAFMLLPIVRKAAGFHLPIRDIHMLIATCR